MTTTSRNSGQFTSWHMERKSTYGNADSTDKPAPGERESTIVTDGRPAGTHMRKNAWHDGGAGARGARAHELNKFEGTASAKQSPNDAPFMAGDRSRTERGTLRQLRGDQLVANNPTIKQRAPELIGRFETIDELRDAFKGMSVSAITSMTKAVRAKFLSAPPSPAQGSQIASAMGQQQSGS